MDAPGHTLGRTSSSNGSGPLTPAELRQRRLAALGGGPAAPSPSAMSTTTTASLPSGSRPSPPQEQPQQQPLVLPMSVEETEGGIEIVPAVGVVLSHPDDDEDDDDLQAALAMSMMVEEEETAAVVSGGTAAAETRTPKMSLSTSGNVEYHLTQRTVEDFSWFQKIMWDSAVTTDSDIKRWIGQGIDVRDEKHDSNPRDGPAQQPPPAAATAAAAAAGRNQDGPTTTQSARIMDIVSKDYVQWGLLQQHGGPCGVLAAVQAEMLRLLIWPDSKDGAESSRAANTAHDMESALTREGIHRVLAQSISIILVRAALTPPAFDTKDERLKDRNSRVKLVLPTLSVQEAAISHHFQPGTTPVGVSEESKCNASLSVYTVSVPEPTTVTGGPKRQKVAFSIQDEQSPFEVKVRRLARAVTAVLLSSLNESGGASGCALDSFRQPGGVLLLVASLVASRGRALIEKEFDDPVGTRLTSQFGHCSQELINLLLTGQAVSNVFDNTLTPSGEMICRGIQSQPTVGYLSQLESMRYCEVGSFYKSPRFPVWVVGSTSHFTVLFGEEAALKESESDLLLERCRRAFKGVEGGEENGFIAKEQLGQVLKKLDLSIADHHVQTLAVSLEVSGAGIILWDEFWKVTSRLLTGATVESVLQGDQPATEDDNDSMPPLLLANHPANEPAPTTKNPETDEEMARRLAAEWNNEPAGIPVLIKDGMDVEVKGGLEMEVANGGLNHVQGGMATLSEAARAASPMEVDSTGLSDEDLARKLQAEWDRERLGADTASIAAVNGSPIPDVNDDSTRPPTPPRTNVDMDSKPAAKKESSHNFDFEKYGDSFALFHYNGLRGGVLTPFTVTRLSAEEAVGASIALNRNNLSASGSSSGSDADLEDVVRTKWPSCIVNWLGKSPPYID